MEHFSFLCESFLREVFKYFKTEEVLEHHYSWVKIKIKLMIEKKVLLITIEKKDHEVNGSDWGKKMGWDEWNDDQAWEWDPLPDLTKIIIFGFPQPKRVVLAKNEPKRCVLAWGKPKKNLTSLNEMFAFSRNSYALL